MRSSVSFLASLDERFARAGVNLDDFRVQSAEVIA